MPIPRTVLLLHGMGGSGQGSVSLLEAELRLLGWHETRFLRPTARRQLPLCIGDNYTRASGVAPNR